MLITPSDASSALLEISAASRAAKTAYGYRRAAPHLILWGVIWALGYGATFFAPWLTWLWPVLDTAGVAGSFWLGARSRVEAASRLTRQWFGTIAAVSAFIAALAAIAPPLNTTQVSAFFPILVALFYALLGIWATGRRMIVMAILIWGLTIGGYFWLQPVFTLWMAVVGGGALILGGLWLRRP